MKTEHARKRMQQRGIPPLVDRWLDDFGEERYNGAGYLFRYFTKRAVRAIERCEGRAPVRILSRYLDTYKVVSSTDGATITIGHRTRRLRTL